MGAFRFSASDSTKRHKVRCEMKYSKIIVMGIIILNCLFALGVLYTHLKTSTEPTALVAAWFSFTTVELWSCASIKKTEIKGERKENKNNGND